MISRYVMNRGLGPGKSFRNRGRDVSRMEGFSDTVFGFALTLLIVQTQPVQSYNDLMKVVHGLLVFFICFANLTSVWYFHYRFCRRYGLEDHWTIVLNLLLLFIILFYVYPLKYLFSLALDPSLVSPVNLDQAITVFVIYGLGFSAVFLLLVLFYAHAYRLRKQLELSELETYDTITSLTGSSIMIFTGLISVVIALVLRNPDVAGNWYLSILVTRTIHGTIRGRRRAAIEAHTAHTTNQVQETTPAAPANS